MNERAKHLQNAPQGSAPKTTLTTAREINAAVMRNLSSGNYGVYCSVLENHYRVFKARTRDGVLEVKIDTGTWIKPRRVWSEG